MQTTVHQLTSQVASRLQNAVATTAALQFALNAGQNDRRLWFNWVFAVEALPVFDVRLIARVRSLVWHGIVEPGDSVAGAYDVKQAFAAVSAAVRSDYLS